MERLSKKIIEGAIFISTGSVNEKLKEAFPEAKTIEMDRKKQIELDVRGFYIIDDWFKDIVEGSLDFDCIKFEYVRCNSLTIEKLTSYLKVHVMNKKENEKVNRRNKVLSKAIDLGKIRSELLVLSRDLYGIHQEESDALYRLAQQAENIQTDLYQSEMIGRVSNHEWQKSSSHCAY